MMIATLNLSEPASEATKSGLFLFVCLFVCFLSKGLGEVKVIHWLDDTQQEGAAKEMMRRWLFTSVLEQALSASMVSGERSGWSHSLAVPT